MPSQPTRHPCPEDLENITTLNARVGSTVVIATITPPAYAEFRMVSALP